MWKKCRESLNLRVFLLTFGLVLLVCAAVGGLAVSLAPLSHATLLENRLDGQLEALCAQLESSTPEEGEKLLAAFSRQNSADVCLMDGEGRVRFASSQPTRLQPQPETAQDEMVTEVIVSVEEDTPGMAVLTQDAATGEVQTVVVEESGYADYRSSRVVVFTDGTTARLALTGSMEAVGQTAQVMRSLLPAMALLALGLSLLVAFVFARFITRPVVALSRIAGRMAAQDFAVRWQGGRRDEIGRLGESLNQLSENLSGALWQLQKSNAALEDDIQRERELEGQRSAFFAAASHELKTPITILKGQLSGMLAQVGPYRNREQYLARSLAVTGRMEALVREMLTISRLEAGGCCMAQVNLSALVEKLLQENSELADSRNMMVNAAVEGDITVEGNEELLQNALDNILMNALLHSPAGEAVQVTLTEGCLMVENTGASIPEDALPRLFEPFYRVEASRSRETGGSGLGLYLVRCIARQHGMQTEICNGENGVRFRLTWGKSPEEKPGQA